MRQGIGVVTHHRLLGATYLPLGTTAHKQGRVAGENAVGGQARLSPAASALRWSRCSTWSPPAPACANTKPSRPGSHRPLPAQSSPDDHKAYYPTAHPITIRLTGDTSPPAGCWAPSWSASSVAEIAKRVDVYATGIHHDMTVNALNDLDLSYTPPLGSPWDAIQLAAQTWTRQVHPR